MRFLRLEFLDLFFLLPLILISLFLSLKSKFRARKTWEESKLRDISEFSSKAKEILMYCLVVLVVGLIIFALAGPQISYDKSAVIKKSLDIVCLIDLSRSMNTRDVFWGARKVFRLDLVKEELRNFAKDHVGKKKNQMALIAFGNEAIYRSFFTFDVGSLLFHVDYLDVKDFPPEGTDIGGAIRIGLEMLDTIDSNPEIFKRPKNRRVFILISDGEDLGENLDQAIGEIRQRRIPVYAIGVGSRAGGYVVEEIDEQGRILYMKDEDEGGQRVYSKLEEETLKKIARATGGKYIYSEAGENLTKGFKDVLERESEKERKTEKAYYDIWLHLFGGVFVLCLLIVVLKQN